jgi:hypothetical protein
MLATGRTMTITTERPAIKGINMAVHLARSALGRNVRLAPGPGGWPFRCVLRKPGYELGSGQIVQGQGWCRSGTGLGGG